MIPWSALLVFLGISVGTTTAIAVICTWMGWTVNSAAWALLVPIAMWAPAAGRAAARRSVDRGFDATLSLRRWGVTGARVVLLPLACPIVVYGGSYAIAWAAGFVRWSPGGGNWTTGRQIAANLLVNLSILGVLGTFTAMGEEIGWRGYLQPRLDAAGVRASVAIVWLSQVAYHAPLMIGAGYAEAGSLPTSLALFTIGDLPVTFIMAAEAYRARSLWPAVFFHSFHNTISQWLFPRFFAVAGDQFWLQGEAGLLPVAGYVVLGGALYVRMRQQRQSWQELARSG
jgi:membrane protease YdiL (CAAX protease family)